MSNTLMIVAYHVVGQVTDHMTISKLVEPSES